MGNEPVFAASYARRRSLEVDPVTFACRVAFFQDSTWLARMWEYSLAVETPCGLRASSGTGPRDCQSAITTWNRRTCGSEESHHAPTGDATNRACQAGRTAEEHSVPNAHANVDRGGACEGGSQNSLGGHERRGRTGTRIAVARSPAPDAADSRGDWALTSAPILLP